MWSRLQKEPKCYEVQNAKTISTLSRRAGVKPFATKRATGPGISLWLPKKEPQVLLPAARDHLNDALTTASRPLPREAQEEAKDRAAINA